MDDTDDQQPVDQDIPVSSQPSQHTAKKASSSQAAPTSSGQPKATLNNNMSEDPKMKSSIMRVLVATDNHLGYLEKDPIRGDDSFNSFEEILQYAHKLKVDMVLLGGDLFHDNKPSRSCLYRTIELFRKYCLGDTPVKIQFLSDQTVNFCNKFHTVNYEDPNFNISLPVFSIHGNHDDPTGEGGLAALDLLSVSNLVNYFGKTEDIDDISVYPLLLSKGETKLAIYGLGNIRDERLYRTFQKQQVKMMRPIESKDEWFNILVLHQNRVAHNPKNYVHEQMIDNFIDFVVWGHEHECLINPQASAVGEFHITQPGSSVATALSEGESKEKFVGLLEVYKNQFRFKTHPLTTVRPFILDNLVLADSKINPAQPTEVVDYIAQKVDSMIELAAERSQGKPTEKMLPLIRLKIDYTGYSTTNPQKFGQRYVGKVANPNDILLFTRKKSTVVIPKGKEPAPKDETIRVEDFIPEFLNNTAADRLSIISEPDLVVALHNFVYKEESDSILALADLAISKAQQFLRRKVDVKDAHQAHVLKVIEENLPLNVLAVDNMMTPVFGKLAKQKGAAANGEDTEDEEDDKDKYAVDDDFDEDSHKDHNHHHASGAMNDNDDDEDDTNDGLFDTTALFKTPTSAQKKTPARATASAKKTPASTPPSSGGRGKKSANNSPYSTPYQSQSQSQSSIVVSDDEDNYAVDDQDDDETKSPSHKKRTKKSDPSPTTKSKKSRTSK
ncbi:hypothetical protein SAMD00019534_076960 [Acytostelium subglobosum LB1]|uniref:hypothetical protein n=1 Tax=Acytostelium subglobosum LB1 TaxID=1410327 RepID=UPI00064516E5|nr:hypothetical protein SAMD00019534_076960 [Acytostelium subglobosum LB1]GAM24521.1 hypothetical protein SAMD00019534_076960 [Acytostelium subglobosum LB1]|eukprot:XP_012752847.1 hypothetical protein SAMD00019534_076960 [Acytostelium subglobosum LB1]